MVVLVPLAFLRKNPRAALSAKSFIQPATPRRRRLLGLGLFREQVNDSREL